MALVVETGAIITGANTYVSLSFADTFCVDLGLTSWAALGTSSREAAILRGMAFVETMRFKGVKSDVDQPLKWPRDGVYDEDGFAIEPDAIPEALKKGTARAAYEEGIIPGALQGSRETGIKRQKVDVLEIEYFTHSGNVQSTFDGINGYLAGLLRVDFGADVRRT